MGSSARKHISVVEIFSYMVGFSWCVETTPAVIHLGGADWGDSTWRSDFCQLPTVGTYVASIRLQVLLFITG